MAVSTLLRDVGCEDKADMAKLYVTPAQFNAFKEMEPLIGIRDGEVRARWIGLISVLVLDGRGDGINMPAVSAGLQEIELVVGDPPMTASR